MTRDKILDKAIRQYLTAFEPVNRMRIAKGWLTHMPVFVPAHIRAQFYILAKKMEGIDVL